MKAALLHVRHVQKHVTIALNTAKEILVWNSAKNCAGNVQMPAANVRMNAEAAAQMHSLCNNVQMPVKPVQMNAKSTTMTTVSVVLKSAGSAKQNAERWLPDLFNQQAAGVKALRQPVTKFYDEKLLRWYGCNDVGMDAVRNCGSSCNYTMDSEAKQKITVCMYSFFHRLS